MDSPVVNEQKTKQEKPEKRSKEAEDGDRERNREYTAAIDSEILALQSDLSTLVNQFAALQTLNYQDFVGIWQSRHMPEVIVIATGQRPNRELRFIMDEALSHSAKLFAELSVGQQTKQHGALYLLYSLYFIQPTIPKIKIRFTLEMWQKLKAFLEEAIATKQWDVVFVGGNLVEAGAFHFVASLDPLIPEKAKQYKAKSKSTATTAAGAASSSTGAKPGEKPAPTIDALLQRLSRDTNEFELAQTEYLQAKEALGSLRLPGLDRADAGTANDIMSKIRRLADPTS